MTTIVYGVDPKDGILTPCKAKPENRGRGRCPHDTHHELDESAEVIARFNEEKLAEVYGKQAAHKKGQKPVAPPVKSMTGGKPLTRDEFRSATHDLAEAFPEDDWEYINKFYQDFHGLIEENKRAHHATHATESIHAYLTGDTVTAGKVREFLGPEVDLKDFSQILVSEVKSMKASAYMRNSKQRDGISRIVTTNVNNDMTRERYVASVLFFGGRCCYCNCVMTKQPGATQATGEHITPLASPDGRCGGTRYGNMALACMACNNERGNQDLEEWMASTKLVAKENKSAALQRIKKFREFALYRDYSKEESAMILTAIEELRETMKEYPSRGKVYKPEHFELLKEKVHSRIFELQQELNK